MAEKRPTPPLRPSSALDWPAEAGCVGEVLAGIEERVRARRRRVVRRMAGVAAVALLAVGVFFWREPAVVRSVPASAIVSVPVRQLLPDGSVVELKGDANVRVSFTEACRRVELVRGEAHFLVAKNPDRPFVVVAGTLEVKAVGTAFAVQLAPAAVEVLVTEGRVALQAMPRAAGGGEGGGSAKEAAAPSLMEPVSARPALALVDRGNRAVVPAVISEATPTITPVSTTEMADRLSWRVPRLEFNGTPLAEAVELLNRHSSVRLELGDEDIGKLLLSGSVRSDNVGALVRLLEMQYGLEAVREGSGAIRLQRGGL